MLGDLKLLLQNSDKSWFVWLPIVEFHEVSNGYYILHRFPHGLWVIFTEADSLLCFPLTVSDFCSCTVTFDLHQGSLISLIWVEIVPDPLVPKIVCFPLKSPEFFKFQLFYSNGYRTCLYIMICMGVVASATYTCSCVCPCLFRIWGKNLFAARHCCWAFMESFISALPLTTGALKVHIHATLPSLFKGAGDSNSGPRAYRVDALTTEPSPQLPARFLFVFKSTNQRLS